MPSRPAHVVVVGGGIAGLAAAYRLRTTAPRGTHVTLLEASDQVGGKLRTSEVAGVDVDEGAESLLARVPEAVELARAVGLGAELVNPATTAASLWTRGALRPLPAGSVMGVPADLDALERSGVLSSAALLRLPLDVLLPRTSIGEDMPVGAYVARRLGREVVERLVDPLLGGVYAGDADALSLEATLPQLAPYARDHRSLLAAARAARRAAPQSDAPVFATVRAGLGAFAQAVAAASAADIRRGCVVRGLRPRPDGRWTLTVGPTRAEEHIEADAVVLAVPATPAARLVDAFAKDAARDLAGIAYASVAIVTMAFRRGSLPEPPPGSGWLVPAVERRLTKAVTLASRKWPHLTEGTDLEIVRASVGRVGAAADLQRPDRELVERCAAEVGEALGGPGELVASRVSRWGGALPQYAVGHRSRVARIRAALEVHPTLAVCGAAYDGIGIPACIRTAYSAVDRLLPVLTG